MENKTEKRELKNALDYIKENRPVCIDIITDMLIMFSTRLPDGVEEEEREEIELVLRSVKDVILFA